MDQEDNEEGDFTTAAALKKLFLAHEKPQTHTVVHESLIGLNCNEFFENYLADGAKYSFAKFYEKRGENEVSCETWSDPKTTEEKVYDGKPVLKQRKLTMKVNVNSTFVKVAPTTKYFKILERSPTMIILRMLNRTADIPYCATFGVEEEWFLASPSSDNAKCAVLRMSFQIIWYQSTLMKSVIKNNTDPETKKVMGEFMDDIIGKNGHNFVERVPKPKIKPAEAQKKPQVIDQRAK